MTAPTPRSPAWSTRYLLFIAGMGGLLYGIDVGIRRDATAAPTARAADSPLSRPYVLPFLLACLILACNQATGINSVLAYVVNILDRAGLSGSSADPAGTPQVLTVAYACPFTNLASIRSDDPALPRVDVTRTGTVQPTTAHGWLALSELMPTRIRPNGMSIALLINQFVSTSIAAVFLPTVGRHGYPTIFFGAAFLLPETRGKTLDKIDAFFARPSTKETPLSGA